jgi:hypothetical protein
LTVSVPIELPGASVPPLMVVVPTVPLPPRVPPAFTVVRLDDAVDPFTASVPPFTVVAPVYVLMPDRIMVPVPVLTSLAPVPPPRPPSAMMPVTLVERLLPPTVSSFWPRLKKPPPLIEPALSL